MIALTGVSGAGAVMAGVASANSYHGLLYGGTSTGAASGNAYGANSIVNQQSWTAPSGVQFGGFAYTSAYFGAANADPTGGLSSGFRGSGGSAPTDLNWPWTGDCSISEDASPRTWINNGTQVTRSTTGPGGVAPGACNMNGNTYGFAMDNVETESPNPGTNPQTDYRTLSLLIWCARDANCNAGDAANWSVTNLSGEFDDSYNQPSGGVSWSGGINGSFWVQTNTGQVSLSASATDPAGVCSMQANLGGPANLSSGALGDQNPGVMNVGAEIGTEFSSGTNPCWVGTTDTGSWTLPGGLPAGRYAASLQASDPGNYQAQGFSAGGSPTISTTGSVPIDDVTPQVQMVNPTGSGSWTNATTATVNITTGPSGLSSLTCSRNSTGVGATLQSQNGDSYVYTIPLSSGSGSYSCSAANGDQNGAVVGNSSPAVYQQDATVPSIAFSDGGYTAGTWTADQQSIQVTATGGSSGVTGLGCTLDGNSLPDGNGDTATSATTFNGTQTVYVTVPANGAHNLQCSADNAGTPNIVGSGSYPVDVDSQIPETSFETGAGFAATSTQSPDPQTASSQNWLDGQTSTVTVGLTSTEATVQSGVLSSTCTINPWSAYGQAHAVVLTNVPTSGTVAQSTPYLATFTANKSNGWIDGQNEIQCQSNTLAGLVGADGATAGTTTVEYVDVNDPSWPSTPGGGIAQPTAGQCGISSVIDSGGCAYSDGPSQPPTWYSSTQTLRITADDTGGAAPITAITCSGARMLQSDWTSARDPSSVDAHNGLTVTATITAPGGKIDCTASDSANPADTYELGTYAVAIDPSTPQGHFEPQQYQGAAPNIIQLSLADNPSGVKQVSVQATDENTGVVYAGAELTTNPADGKTAYATLDPNTGRWELTVNPNVFPAMSDKIAFVATATTGAGVTARIDTVEDGSTEIVTKQQLGGSSTSPGSGYALTGDTVAITATARSGHWTAAAMSEAQLPTALQGTSSNPVAPTLVGTIASWKHSVCKAAPEHGKPAKKAPQRFCKTLMSRAPRSEALPAKYNQETEITGTLMNTATNTPLAGGSVGIYVTNLATYRVKLVHVETAGPRGNFRYRLAAGPDRRVDLIYLGQWGVTHGADTAFDTTTAGVLRVHAPRVVRVGQQMRITGRILGGSIQAKGAIVQMEYAIAGLRRGWSPFKPGRSSTTGGFVIRFPITRSSAALTYEVRVKVPAQAGWGFRGATSNVLRFHVK